MGKQVSDSMRPVNRLWRLLKTERKIIYLIFFYAIINGIIVLTLPLGIQAILNFILGGRVSSSWLIMVIIVIAGLTISGLIQIAQLSLTEKLQQTIFAKSSFEIAVRLPKIKLESLQDYYAPEMVNRFFDTVTLQKGLAKLLVDFPTATLQVVFGLLLISIYHPFFLFVSAAVVLMLYILFRYTGPIGLSTSLKESTRKYDVAHWLEEIARTVGTFKLAGISNLPLLKIDKLILGYLYFRRKHFAILITQYKVMVAFKVLVIGALLVMGSLLLIDDQISLGQFVAAEIIIILIMNSIEKIIIGLETVYDVLTSVEKLGSITDLSLENESRPKGAELSGNEGFEVAADNLTFRFPFTERKVLDKLSIAIASGEKLSLVGPAGAGKSTLSLVLCGIYEHYEGRITYNQIPLTALQLPKLRLDIGDNIWQETIFEGSLRENITLGKEAVNDEMVYRALEIVSAIDGVNKLDDGLNTRLFPEGVKLNRSLARKLILARSIAALPKFLIVDLDAETLTPPEKKRFYDYVFQQPWTVLAITRDQDFVSRCGKIAVMQKGAISFTGNFNEFNSSEYAELIG